MDCASFVLMPIHENGAYSHEYVVGGMETPSLNLSPLLSLLSIVFSGLSSRSVLLVVYLFL